jgi:hypothetical protein
VNADRYDFDELDQLADDIRAGHRPLSDWLDPNFEWIDCPNMATGRVEYVKGPCKHRSVIPVEISTGEIVAKLCLVCDQQFRGEGEYA